MVRVLPDQTGIGKTFDLDGEDTPVMVDPTQLHVAILNLAINARDAMPDGGTLGFSTRPVTIAGDPDLADGAYLELAIRDTGSGMTPQVMERALEPFFTTKDVGKGTGLGLSMVYGMARQSGGTVYLQRAYGPLGRVALPSCYPVMTQDIEFALGALEVAERVMESFSLPIPRRCV